MNSLSELKHKLFKNLSDNSIIEEFFQVSLRDRVENENWLDNPLVHIIIKNLSSNINMIEGFINKIRSHNEDLYNSLKNEYSGKDPQFDNKMKDLFAEMHAASWLIGSEFTDIKKLPTGKGRTPDFVAFKDKNYLFEVKNLRTPTELMDLVFTQIKNEHLLYPELYDKLMFTIEIPNDDIPGEIINDTDYHGVMRFILKLHKSVVVNEFKTSYIYKKIVNNSTISKSIQCEWSPSEGFGIIGGSSGPAIWLNDPRRPPIKLRPLLRKTWFAVEYAISQLIEYDKQDSYEKGVLINWQRPREFLIDDDLTDIYKAAIGYFDRITNRLNPKLFIKLLPSDQ